MSRRLFIVEDAFHIEGRGVAPVPGIIPEGSERFRIGDSIQLRRPDGSTQQCIIAGIDLFSNPKLDFPILITGITKDAIPIGTEVWSVDGDQNSQLREKS